MPSCNPNHIADPAGACIRTIPVSYSAAALQDGTFVLGLFNGPAVVYSRACVPLWVIGDTISGDPSVCAGAEYFAVVQGQTVYVATASYVTLTRTLPDIGGAITCLGLSFDGQTLYFGLEDTPTIHAYDIWAEEYLGEFVTHTADGLLRSGIIGLPNGDVIIAWRHDGTNNEYILYNQDGDELTVYDVVGNGGIARHVLWTSFWVRNTADSGVGTLRLLRVVDGVLLNTVTLATLITPTPDMFFVFPLQNGPAPVDMDPSPLLPTIPPPADPDTGDPIVIVNHITDVADAKQQLIDEGVNTNGACGAIKILRRACALIGGQAGLLFQNPSNITLLLNPNHPNNIPCNGLWSFIIAFPTGAFYYALSAPGDINHPEWVFGGVAPTSLYRSP